MPSHSRRHCHYPCVLVLLNDGGGLRNFRKISFVRSSPFLMIISITSFINLIMMRTRTGSTRSKYLLSKGLGGITGNILVVCSPVRAYLNLSYRSANSLNSLWTIYSDTKPRFLSLFELYCKSLTANEMPDTSNACFFFF